MLYSLAISPFSSDTNILILIRQMLTSIKIKRLNRIDGISKIVLGASFRSEVVVIAAVLRHLDGPLSVGDGGADAVGAQLESQIDTTRVGVHVH